MEYLIYSSKHPREVVLFSPQADRRIGSRAELTAGETTVSLSPNTIWTGFPLHCGCCQNFVTWALSFFLLVLLTHNVTLVSGVQLSNLAGLCLMGVHRKCSYHLLHSIALTISLTVFLMLFLLFPCFINFITGSLYLLKPQIHSKDTQSTAWRYSHPLCMRPWQTPFISQSAIPSASYTAQLQEASPNRNVRWNLLLPMAQEAV